MNNNFTVECLDSGQQMLHFLQSGSTQINICENAQYRWLLLDDLLQTVMDKGDTARPVLPHLHALLLSLFYKNNPKNAIELGLGGGALSRFFQEYLPESKFRSVELNADIIDCYQRFFAAPDDIINPIHDDAQKRIKSLKDIDWLAVDLFSGQGNPAFLHQSPFYQDCLAALSNDGVLVLNVIPAAELEVNWIEELLIESGFSAPRVFCAPGYRNRILVTAKFSLPRINYGPDLIRFCDTLDIDLNLVSEMK